MRKVLKYSFRILATLLLFLVLFAIAMPLLFKNEIIDSVRRAINRQIEGALYFEKAEVGILRTFPNLCLDLTSPVLTGGLHPDGDSLFAAKSLGIVIDVRSLLRKGSATKIVGIEMSDPKVSLYSDTAGVTNYQLISDQDTLTADTTAEDVAFEIEHYQIENGHIRYVDAANDLHILASELDHDGRLRYAENTAEMRTKTSSGILTIVYDDIAYLDGVHVQGNNDLDIDFERSLYTLIKNNLLLNALEVEVHGAVSQPGDDTVFDLDFASARNDFKELVSLLPNIYTGEYDALRASGNIALTGSLKGTLSESTFPVYDVFLKVDNGSFQYPGKPLGFREVSVQGSLKNASGGWQPIVIHLPNLHFLLNNRPFDARLDIQNPTGKMTANGIVKGIIDLADVNKAYPLPQVSSLQGLVDADLTFDISAARSTTEQKVSGDLKLKNIALRTNNEEIMVQAAEVEFTPTTMHAITQTASWNGSSVHADLQAQDYIDWLINDKPMTLAGILALEKFDANRYISTEEASSAQTVTPTDPGLSMIRFDGTVSIDTLIYDTYVIEKGQAVINGALPSFKISQMNGKIRGTQFTAQGSITDADKYLDGSAPLSGTLDCKLDNVYIDRWIEAASSSGSGTAEGTTYIALPADLKLDMTFRANALQYDNIEINNPRGSVHLADQILEIHDFKGDGMGGGIVFSGLYNPQDIRHPAFSMKYDLSALKFSEAFRQIGTFQKLAPIAEYVQGVFNSVLVFEGHLGENYFPDFNTLTASGYIETLTGTLQHTDILEKVSKFLNLKKPIHLDLTKTRNWFEIKEGYVHLQEIHKTIEGIDLSLGGRHRIQGDMDYLIKLNIPADRITTNPVGELAQAGFEQLQSKAAQFGVKLNTIESFVVHVAMRGKLSDPKFEILLFDASGKSLKEVAAEQLVEIKEQIRDTIVSIADAKIEEAKDSIRTVIETAIDSAQKAAEDKLREAGEEAISKTTERLDSTLRDSITKVVLDKIGEKAIDSLGKKETDKIKDALEQWDPFKKKKKN